MPARMVAAFAQPSVLSPQSCFSACLRAWSPLLLSPQSSVLSPASLHACAHGRRFCSALSPQSSVLLLSCLRAWSPLLLSPQSSVLSPLSLHACAHGRRFCSALSPQSSVLLLCMPARMVAALVRSGAFFSIKVLYKFMMRKLFVLWDGADNVKFCNAHRSISVWPNARGSLRGSAASFGLPLLISIAKHCTWSMLKRMAAGLLRLTWSFARSILQYVAAGWSSQVARRAHNPKVLGSNPSPAIKTIRDLAKNPSPSLYALDIRSHNIPRPRHITAEKFLRPTV